MNSFPWHTLNRTELLQIAKQAGERVSSGAGKKELVELMSCEREIIDSLPPNAVDLWRDALIRFILDHWSTIQTQVSCPAKELGSLLHIRSSNDNTYKVPSNVACHTCPDVRVLACVDQQKKYIDLVIRRKETTMAPVSTTRKVTMAANLFQPISTDIMILPSTAEEVGKLGSTWLLKGIAVKLGLIHTQDPQVPPYGGLPQTVTETAFRALDRNVQCQAIADAIKMYQAMNGAGKQAAPPAPPPQPAQAAPAVQEVAQPAEAPPAKTRSRAPVVRTPAVVEDANVAPPAQQAPAVNAEIMKFVANIYSTMSEANEVIKACLHKVEDLQESVNELRAENQQLAAENKRWAVTAAHIAASLAQQVFEAPPEDIIEESAKYADTVLGASQQASQVGKG